MLAVERESVCAAVDSAGGAQSSAQAKVLPLRMIRAVKSAKVPIFFFHAANDWGAYRHVRSSVFELDLPALSAH